MIQFLVTMIVALLGLCVGSFLNVVICRLENGRSPLKDRSQCPHCGHMLVWQDLIPVVSFLLLRGKCRYCKQKISWQYPLVEILTASIFLAIFNVEFLIFNQFQNVQILQTLYLFIIASLLIVLFVYDLKHYTLPDKILLPAIGTVALYHIVDFVISHWDLIRNLKLEIGNFEPLLYVIASALFTSAFFFAIYAFSRGRWMGFGDVKLALFMGLFLGWPNILVALFCAFFLGAAVGVFLVLSRKKEWKSKVPFGPFLITGTFIALFWGQSIVDWYLRFVLV